MGRVDFRIGKVEEQDEAAELMEHARKLDEAARVEAKQDEKDKERNVRPEHSGRLSPTASFTYHHEKQGSAKLANLGRRVVPQNSPTFAEKHDTPYQSTGQVPGEAEVHADGPQQPGAKEAVKSRPLTKLEAQREAAAALSESVTANEKLPTILRSYVANFVTSINVSLPYGTHQIGTAPRAATTTLAPGMHPASGPATSRPPSRAATAAAASAWANAAPPPPTFTRSTGTAKAVQSGWLNFQPVAAGDEIEIQIKAEGRPTPPAIADAIPSPRYDGSSTLVSKHEGSAAPLTHARPLTPLLADSGRTNPNYNPATDAHTYNVVYARGARYAEGQGAAVPEGPKSPDETVTDVKPT